MQPGKLYKKHCLKIDLIKFVVFFIEGKTRLLFSQNAPSQMFGRVLNTPLVMSSLVQTQQVLRLFRFFDVVREYKSETLVENG